MWNHANPTNTKSSPYPHFYQDPLLPHDLAQVLTKSYPDYLTISKGNWDKNNFRFNYSSVDVLSNKDKVPVLWHQFIERNASQDFFNKFCLFFENHLTSQYPHLGKNLKELSKLKVGIRKINTFATHDVLIDIQIAGNTPVHSTSSVRGRHIDDPRKLFGGLMYLRLNEDSSTGGDFEISYPKNNHYKFYNNVYVKDKYAKTVEIVPYKNNNFVLFLNGPTSWHGVTPRQPTQFPRLFVNVIAEVKDPLFKVTDRVDQWDKLLTKLQIRRYDKYDF
jgi:hypothetical protein